VTDALGARHAFAIDLAREAGALASDMRGTLGALEAKNPMDYATRADHAVEALIRRRIAERFGDPVIGEEDGRSDRRDGELRSWDGPVVRVDRPGRGRGD
jgi:myo-inositol-1(or 4)-monophosphatase